MSRVKGQGHRLDIVVKTCKQYKDSLVRVRPTVKLGTHTRYGKKITPFDF